MKKLIFIIFCFRAAYGFAQPMIEWQRAYGGTRDEEGHSICPSNDGGYFVAGYSSSNNYDVASHYGGEDFWVMKLDEAGAIIWQRSLGGSGNDQAHFVCATTDGGCALGGRTYSSNGDLEGLPYQEACRAWVVKLDATGAVEWQKTFYGGYNTECYSIQQTTDGGYIVNTYTTVNPGTASQTIATWMLKLNSSGEVQWDKIVNTDVYNAAYRIKQTADGGYIAVGGAQKIAGQSIDFWVARFNAVGEMLWEVKLGGSDDDEGTDIQETSDGGFIAAGYNYSSNGDATVNHGLVDCWVVKLTGTGAVQWKKSYGGAYWEESKSIVQTSDGGYILLAETGSIDGDVSHNWGSFDFWVVKLNASGVIQWESNFGGDKEDRPFASCLTTDGGYIMTGETASVNGDILLNNGQKDLWVAKLSGVVGVKEITSLPQFGDLEIYPNPAGKQIIIQTASEEAVLNVMITDMLGQTLLRQFIVNNSSLDISGLPNGIYQVIATTTSGQAYFNKLMKQE